MTQGFERADFIRQGVSSVRMRYRGDADAWYNKGYALFERGMLTEAKDAFSRVLEINPGDTRTWVILGNVFMESCQYEEAIHAYDQVLQAIGSDPDIWVHKGNAYLSMGKKKEARQAFDQALNIEPDHPYALYCRDITIGELE